MVGGNKNTNVNPKLVLFDLTAYTFWDNPGISDDTVLFGTYVIDFDALYKPAGDDGGVEPLDFSKDVYNIKQYVIDYVFDHLENYLTTRNISKEYKSQHFRNIYNTPCIKFNMINTQTKHSCVLFATNINFINKN